MFRVEDRAVAARVGMWIIEGAEPGSGRVRQHQDLSYFVSDDEVTSALGASARPGPGSWPVTSALELLLASRQGCPGLQANLGPDAGPLEFYAVHRDDWDSLAVASWAQDEARSPGCPKLAARAAGREVVWHLEGFDPARQFMVEDFELSHRISEPEIFAALGNPPHPYHGGLPPTSALADLIIGRIGLPVRRGEVDYQVNSCSRYCLAEQRWWCRGRSEATGPVSCRAVVSLRSREMASSGRKAGQQRERS
jgi:hypothetical protein